MKYSYTPYVERDDKGLTTAYRIADEKLGRVATCYVEENARLVVDRMNKGELGHRLFISLRALKERAIPNTPHWMDDPELVEASEALAEWEQLTKAPA